MKTNISKIICTMLAMVLVLSLSACGASKGFKAKADATWGDLCRNFDSEWYDALAEEVRTQYDAIALTAETFADSEEATKFTGIDPVSFTVYGEDYTKMSTRYGSISTNGLALMANEQDTSIEYTASVMSTVKDVTADMVVIVALIDAESGAYVAFDKATVTVDANAAQTLTGSFSELTSGHKYIVKAICVANAPQGYKCDGPLFVEKEITTK